MKYLGVDYGKSKVGLAVSEGELASPLKILEVSGLNDSLEKMQRVALAEKVDLVVVGMPEGGEAQKISQKFVIELRKRGFKVLTTEETLSSKKGRELMVAQGVAKNKRAKEDAYSATLILQEFLDKK